MTDKCDAAALASQKTERESSPRRRVRTLLMVSPLPDHELIRIFVRRRDPRALGEVAARYVDFVYATARRGVTDPHRAADVTRAVFVILMQKAAALQSPGKLTGWLFRTTHSVATNARQTAAERPNHERGAAREPPREFLDLAINASLNALPAGERDVLLLHFFRRMDYATIAAEQRLSEAVLRKRASRGIYRLRYQLARRHIASTEHAAAVAVLGRAAAERAPADVGSQIVRHVGSGDAATPTATALSNRALAAIASAKAKVIATAVAALLLLGAMGTQVARQTVSRHPRGLPATSQSTMSTSSRQH